MPYHQAKDETNEANIIPGGGGATEATLIQVRDYVDTVETKLQSIIDNTDGLEGFTDGLEGLLTDIKGFVDQLEGFVDGIEGQLALLNLEATQQLIKTAVQSIDTDIDVALSTRASETTVASILAQLDVALSTRASQVTVASILAQLDVALSTRASEATLIQVRDYLDTVETKLQSIIDNTDTVESKLQSIMDNTDGLEGFLDTVETKLQSIIDNTDTVESKLQSIMDNTDTLETKLQTVIDEITRGTTGATTSVAGSTSSVTLLASNSARKGFTIFNDSTSVLYVKLGSTSSSTSFMIKMSKDDFFQYDSQVYTGIVTGIWVSATGNARITEVT